MRRRAAPPPLPPLVSFEQRGWRADLEPPDFCLLQPGPEALEGRKTRARLGAQGCQERSPLRRQNPRLNVYSTDSVPSKRLSERRQRRIVGQVELYLQVVQEQVVPGDPDADTAFLLEHLSGGHLHLGDGPSYRLVLERVQLNRLRGVVEREEDRRAACHSCLLVHRTPPSRDSRSRSAARTALFTDADLSPSLF